MKKGISLSNKQVRSPSTYVSTVTRFLLNDIGLSGLTDKIFANNSPLKKKRNEQICDEPYENWNLNFEGAKLQNNVNRLLYLVLTSMLLISTSFVEAPRGNGYHIRTVVIDAGHGGHDSGCLGSSAKEKNIALSIALKMGDMIEEKFPDVKVIYTRKTDVFIPLHERAEIANHNKADLFICIHCNSGGKAAYGVETYVMGLHKTEDNLNVAKRENSSILLEEDYKKQYEGFDPNSPEANIIFSLYQNQFMNQSLSFASRVQNQVDEYAGRNNRGVKQAGFLVLYRTAMPSVLVETGFLTNEQEEKFLQTDKGQTAIANCIFRAFKEYKLDMDDSEDGEPASSKMDNRKSNAENKADGDKSKAEISENIIVIDTTLRKEKTVVPIDSTPQAEVKPKTPNDYTTQKAEENKAMVDSAHEKNNSLMQAKTPEKKPAKDNSKNQVKSKVYFTVQIAASTDAAKDLPKYMNIEDVHSIKGDDGFVRFVVGKFSSHDEARKRLVKLKNEGYKDAFLTAYNGDQRITVSEAVELLK